MTRGVLTFAFDNESVNYVQLASDLCVRAAKHLNLPVTLVTDRPLTYPHQFDRVIITESRANGTRQGSWKNLDRYMAQQFTPYDQTVLLDADYVICSSVLSSLFESGQDFLPMGTAYDVTNRRNYLDLNFFGKNHMPSAWATVVYWQKSQKAELIFNMIEMIQQEWHHYVSLYGISERRFRNDYALAISCNTINGHLGHWPRIPWSMATVEPNCSVHKIDQDVFEVRYHDKTNRPMKTNICGQDFHDMTKKHNLIECT